MAGRRAISKPVLYSAVVTWAGFAVYYGIQHAVPVVQNWAVQWSLGREMRSADPRVRLGSVTAMEKGDPAANPGLPHRGDSTPTSLFESRRVAFLPREPIARRVWFRSFSRLRKTRRAETRRSTQILSRIIAGSAIKAEGLPAGSKGPVETRPMRPWPSFAGCSRTLIVKFGPRRRRDWGKVLARLRLAS